MSCFKSTSVRDSNYVDKLNAKFESADVGNGTVQEKIRWDVKMLETMNKIAEELVDNNKKMVNLASEFWERCERQRGLRDSLVKQHQLLMKSEHYIANNDNSQNAVHNIWSSVSATHRRNTVASQDGNSSNRYQQAAAAAADQNQQSRMRNAPGSASNFPPYGGSGNNASNMNGNQYDSLDDGEVDEGEEVNYSNIFSERSTHSVPNSAEATSHMINARAEMFGKKLSEMAHPPIPITVDCCVNAIKSMKGIRKQALTDKDNLHTAKAKLKKQELKDDDKQTLEVTQLQSKVDALNASYERSHDLYCTQFTHFTDVEIATLKTEVEKSMHNMLLWQIRKSYESLNSWFLQQSLLRLENKNERANMRRNANNPPSNALALYHDLNNLESYANNSRSNNNYNNYNHSEGNMNQAYDKNYLSNSRADYNNNNNNNLNNNYTFAAGSTNHLPNVQEVVETVVPVPVTEKIIPLPIDHTNVPGDQREDIFANNNINNIPVNTSNNTVSNTNANHITQPNEVKGNNVKRMSLTSNESKQNNVEENIIYPNPVPLNIVIENTSTNRPDTSVPNASHELSSKPVERCLNGVMNEAASPANPPATNNNKNNDEENSQSANNASTINEVNEQPTNANGRSSLEEYVSKINHILADTNLEDLENEEASATNSVKVNTNSKLPPTTREWTEAQLPESNINDAVQCSQWSHELSEQNAHDQQEQEARDANEAAINCTPTVVNPSKVMTLHNINDELVKTPHPIDSARDATCKNINRSANTNDASPKPTQQNAKGSPLELEKEKMDNNTHNNNNKNVINKNNNSLPKNIVSSCNSLPSSTVTSHPPPCGNICIDLSSDDGESANNKNNNNASNHDNNVERDEDKVTLVTPVRPAIISVDRSGATECAADIFSVPSHMSTNEKKSQAISTPLKDNAMCNNAKATNSIHCHHSRSTSDASVHSVTSVVKNAHEFVPVNMSSFLQRGNVNNVKPSAPKESVEPVREASTFTIRNVTVSGNGNDDDTRKSGSLPPTKLTQERRNRSKVKKEEKNNANVIMNEE